MSDHSIAGSPRPRILLAERDDWVRVILTRIASDAGWEVRDTSSDEEAFAEILTENYDCALIDFQFLDHPQDIATRYTAFGRGRTPIIALTTDSSVAATRRCFAAGARRVLNKPIRTPQILDAVAQIVDTMSQGPHSTKRESTTVETISRERLARLGEVHRETRSLSEAIRGFFLDANSLAERLIESIRAADARELERLACSLEESASVYGAVALQRLSGDIRAVPMTLLSLGEREMYVARLRACLKAMSEEFDRHLKIQGKR